MRRIDIIPLKLENQIPIGEDGALWVELHVDYIKMRHEFTASEPKDIEDKSLGWEVVRNSYELFAFKKFIVGVEREWISNGKKWAIYIMVEGKSTDIKWYYRTEAKATETFNIIQDWLLGT